VLGFAAGWIAGVVEDRGWLAGQARMAADDRPCTGDTFAAAGHRGTPPRESPDGTSAVGIASVTRALAPWASWSAVPWSWA
jgi:hypothetical protein